MSACEFRPDDDSCQATRIERCTYCGVHRGNPCHKDEADRSMVTAYHFGNLAQERRADAEGAIAAGVQPYYLPPASPESSPESGVGRG